MVTPGSSISPSERRTIALLFVYGFGTAAAYVLARTIADSAFLSHIGPEHLPSLYMLSAGVVALSSLIYGQLVRRFRLRQLVVMTLLLLGVSSAILPSLMHRFSNSLSVFAMVYLLAQVRGTMGTIQYATLLNEQFGHNRPERVVGIAGAGATFAGIAVGLGIGLFAERVDVEGLMYLAAAIDVVTIIPILYLRQSSELHEQRLDDGQGTEAPTLDAAGFRLRDAMRTPFVISIALVVSLSVLAATLVEYQWKVTVASEFHRDEEELAQYFGYFYASVYLLTGLIQLAVTGRVLRGRGVLIGLLAFPGALLLTTGTAWLLSAQRFLLWPVTMSKACDTFKRSLNDPSLQVLYSPLEPGLRDQAITFVAGIAKPFAEAVAAVSLVAMTPWLSQRQLTLTVIVVVALWITAGVRVWRQFRKLRAAD